ncbi:Lsr2 family protein [Actinophytocola sp.]|uniref:histone-like nucleoid-structuring protein Lsr2 n=1 Tax=Actinophytocola sp. TaxID=1872138 RepID=UPI00389A9BF3
MAQKVLVQLVDDLDGTASTDVSTVLFGLDGISYEIDLAEDNAEQLRDTLAEFVDSARRVGGRIKRGSTTSSPGTRSNGEAGQIRAWALENGFGLSGRGRIPSHVVEAYKEAKDAQAAKTPRARSSTRGRKGSVRAKKKS